MDRNMCATRIRSFAVAVGLGLAVFSGCVGPKPGATTRPTTTSAPVTSSRPVFADRHFVGPHDRVWRPGSGRLTADLAKRHGLQASAIRKSGLGQTVFWEDFNKAKGGSVPGWQRVGDPAVVIRADSAQGKWLQLSSPKAGTREGLSRQLPADDLAGHVVRLRARLLQRGIHRAKTTDLPQIELRWQDGKEIQGSLRVPLPTYSSPGWEVCEACAKIPPGVNSVKLVLAGRNADSNVGLDDILVERVEPLQISGVAGTGGPRDNLIDGGDFEVGQRNFSVYGARWVPTRRELRACSLPWTIDEESKAAVGKRSLRIPLKEAEFRVAFGWVRVSPGKEYVVSVFARSNTKVVLRIGVVEYPGVFRFEYFDVDEKFRRMALKVKTKPDVPWSALAIVIRPSDLPKDSYAKSNDSCLWLDGVSLTSGNPEKGFSPASPVEIGVIGPGFDPMEIGHIVQVGAPTSLAVRLANYQKVAYQGPVAVDIVDAFDRPVKGASRIVRAKIEPSSSAEQKLPPIKLPRGYYKMLASAWPKTVGKGRPFATAERAFAVLDLTDPVPTENYFGMTVERPRMSRRITQLGAGWIWLRASRVWCETSDGKLHWSWYKDLLGRAAKQRLEVLANLDWVGPDRRSPSTGSKWRGVCREFSTAGKGMVDAIAVLDPDAFDDLTLAKYTELLGQASAEIRAADPKSKVFGTITGNPAANQFAWLKRAKDATALVPSAHGLALRFKQTPLPEDIEPALEEIRSWRKTYPFKKYVDVAVGQRGPSGYLHVPNLYGYHADDATSRPDTTDPVLHASHLVRALAIRQYAIIDRAAWWVESHRPPDILRPTVAPQCHEYDNAPRPCLAAFDFMAEMLNPTALSEWIDLPHQTRALCFDHANGNMIVLIWRPFGSTLLSVNLEGMAGKVAVYDLFGHRERHPVQGGDLLVMANEAVRYIVVPAAVKDKVLQALRQPIPVTTTSPTSLPAAMR